MIQRVEAGRELTQAALNDLGRALPELITAGVTRIYLDASRVVEFDSHTLEGVLEFEAFARSRGLHVAVVNPSETLALALDITGLWDRVEVREASDAVLLATGRVTSGRPSGEERSHDAGSGAGDEDAEPAGHGSSAR